jgi:hypothetical protein
MLAALTLRDDVVFAEILVGRFAEGPLVFDFSGAELATELKIPILGDFLGFGERVFFRAPAAIATCEICGALPTTAVRSSINVNLVAENRVMFRHGRMPSKPGRKTENVQAMCKLCRRRNNVNILLFLLYLLQSQDGANPILSPLRLPISPSGHASILWDRFGLFGTPDRSLPLFWQRP